MDNSGKRSGIPIGPNKKTIIFLKELDPEWVELIKEAKRHGITIEEIKEFLREES